jgi:SNF2 family DNA or RNA helicase
MININIKNSVKCNGEYSLFMSFPYDNYIVDTIRNCPTRYWDKDNKEWELPLNKLNDIVDKLNNYQITITGESVCFEPKKLEVPKSFNFKTQPFQHQIEGFHYGLTHNKWLLADEQGLGKSKQVIDIALALKDKENLKHCLIVCGVNGLKWNWYNEVSTHSNEKGYILGQRIKRKKIAIPGNKAKLEDVNNLKNINNFFIITNIETLRSVEIASKLAEYCQDGTIGMVAIDEIHKAKDPTSQQGKGILKLQSKYRIGMTGTPVMNTPLDLFIILKWLGYEKHAFYSFKKHYCEMGGFGGYQVVGYKNLDELQEQLDIMMLRRLKEDVLDLPEKIFIDEYVEMTPKQSIIYKEVTNDIKANIDQIKIAPNPLAQLIRLRQATGYTGILSSVVAESAKLDRMEDIVEESISNGKQVVIFSNWTQVLNPAIERLSKYHPAVITGETNDGMRHEMVNKFQSGETKVICGTSGAMGTGITLTAGTVEIFLDEPWTRAAYDQCVDRCHRIGTNTNITVYTLLTKGTIDERVHELVIKKGAMSDALIDGKIVGNKSEIVDYLLS